MYLASLYNSNRNEYDGLMAKIITKAREYGYLLYFTSAQQKEIGLDIVSRLTAWKRQFQQYGSIDDDFITDVAYESQEETVARAVADHLSSKSSKTLKITKEMQAHTVSGHIFIMNHREVGHLYVEKSCGRTASEDLAEFVCSSRSLRSVTIESTMHDIFYSVLANKAIDSKVKTLDICSGDLSERPNASSDLGQFICKLPRLETLTLDRGYEVLLHDDFYSTSSAMASSAKIETLNIRSDDLGERPNASRDLAQFICKMPHLKNLKLVGYYHYDFYSTSSAMASSAKIETVNIRYGGLSDRPNASRDLAQFICKMPHLMNLTLDGCYHDDFYSTSSPMASSAKSVNTCPTLTELTVEDETLRGWQDGGAMFDNVKRVTIQVRSTINYDVIQRIHLPGATELTIQTQENARQPAGFHEEPTSLPNALLNISPQLVKMTFRDLDIGNSKMERILQAFRSPHNLKTLKTIR
eukprot:XP_011678795.1 PREDICTED: uncharacterized protein LOC105445232 [Strongylocentrotus purpuratus]